MTALATDSGAFLLAPETLRSERPFVCLAVREAGAVLEHVCSELQKDKEVVLAALGQDASAYRFVAEELKESPDFLSEMLQRFGVAEDFNSETQVGLQDAATRELLRTS